MAYGRLDVYWPNGNFDSFLLEGETVSIGRSSGCTVVLETDTISRYHTSIRRVDGHTFISDMDSANGTFLDGVQLKENEEREIFGGEEIQIGQLRIIYLADDNQPTTAMSINELDIETQRFEREDFGFRVDVFVPETGIPPGSHKTVEITLSNTSDTEQFYTVSITGLPHGWGRVNRPTLRVNPDETAQIMLNIKPPRRSDTAPGDYPITVIVAHEDNPDKRIEAYAVVEILPYNAFAMALLTKRVTLYDRFSMVLFNQGSAPLPIHVSATSADKSLSFDIPQPQRVLAAGERVEVKGEIRPKRRRIIGQEQEYPFDVLVHSTDAAGFLTAMRGRFVVEPVLPRWSVYAIGGLISAVLVLLGIFLWLLWQVTTTLPQIHTFEADTQQAIQGQRITLDWDAQNAHSYTLLVNDVIAFDNLSEDTTTITLDTSPYADGALNVVLVAHRGERTAEAEVQIDVLQGLQHVYFDVTPAVLVRNVITPMTIRWRVDGAVETRIEGTESIRRAANIPIEVGVSYGTEATFDTQAYVTDSFSLTLIAVGQMDVTRTWILDIDVIDPICNANTSDVALYATPDTDAQTVLTIENSDADFVVDRIDASMAWLRVVLPDGRLAWAARSQLTCADTFAPENLLIEVTRPTPIMPTTATPPPTETATP
jgi:hypothetical protein